MTGYALLGALMLGLFVGLYLRTVRLNDRLRGENSRLLLASQQPDEATLRFEPSCCPHCGGRLDAE